MMRAAFTIGGVTYPATSIDVARSHNADTIYRAGVPVGRTRGTCSFTMDAKGEDFDAFARILDTIKLPESMDLTVTYAGVEPVVLRVLRDVWPTDEGGRTVITYPLFQGPRLADGRWSRREVPR